MSACEREKCSCGYQADTIKFIRLCDSMQVHGVTARTTLVLLQAEKMLLGFSSSRSIVKQEKSDHSNFLAESKSWSTKSFVFRIFRKN